MLNEKVAIISGGARGIGAALAKVFVQNGARVVIGEFPDKLGEAVAAELNSGKNARCAQYVHLDATRKADWDHVAIVAE